MLALDFSDLKKGLKEQIGEEDDSFYQIDKNIDNLLETHQ